MRKSTLEALAIDNKKQIDRLDRQNDRLAEEVNDLEESLEREVIAHKADLAVLDDKRNECAALRDQIADACTPMTVSEAPRFPDTAIALRAVSLMLENRSATMAIRVGADNSEYERLVRLGHFLRMEADIPLDSPTESRAVEFYTELTEAF